MNAASATSKGTILVVDDNRLVLATLIDGLTRAGYHVYDADNGDDAILIARAHRPQLALLDIRMEGKSGSTSPTTCAISAACRSCSSRRSPTSRQSRR
jgi:CheY-like chemotaxis protein